MELEEAIKTIEDMIYKDKDKKEYWHYIDICYDEMYEFAEAIEVVLKELDNRIPISKVEKILETTKQLREKEIKELGMSLRGSAVDILESILKNYKE